MSPGLSLGSTRGTSRLPCEECVSSSHCRGLSQITSTYFCIDYVFVSELTLSPSSSCANTCVASATAATTPPSCQEKGVVDWSSENALNILQPSLRLYWQGNNSLGNKHRHLPNILFCLPPLLDRINSQSSERSVFWHRQTTCCHINPFCHHCATLTSRAAVAIRQFTFVFIMSRLS